MLTRLRHLLVALAALSVAAGGLAYAATDDNSGVELVQDTAQDTTPPVIVVEPGGEEVTPSPEDDPAQTDDGALDDVIDDTVADEAADVPVAPEGSGGPVWSTEGCPEGFSGNHGQYVSGTDERPRNEAARSPCGKPVHEDDPDEPEAEVEDETESEDDAGPPMDRGRGRP